MKYTGRSFKELDLVLGPSQFLPLSRITGYVRQHVTRVLRGEGGVSLECAIALANAADVTLDELAYYRMQVGLVRQMQGRAVRR